MKTLEEKKEILSELSSEEKKGVVKLAYGELLDVLVKDPDFTVRI